MLIVTGGIACGKSTFLEVANKMGYTCVDADDWFNEYFSTTIEFHTLCMSAFGHRDLKSVAFVHQNWGKFIQRIDVFFRDFVVKYQGQCNKHDEKIDIICVPDIFQRGGWPLGNDILTIERSYNLKYAIERDTHRSEDLTLKIHQHQMDPGKRRRLADYVLKNEGSKEQFEKECEEWLKQHLPAVSTQPTKDIDTL